MTWQLLRSESDRCSFFTLSHFSESSTQLAVGYRPTLSYVMLPSAASSQLSDHASCCVSVSCIRQLSALSFCLLYSVICSASTANHRVSALPYHPLLSPLQLLLRSRTFLLLCCSCQSTRVEQPTDDQIASDSLRDRHKLFFSYVVNRKSRYVLLIT